jgi:hypothetical protein
MVAVLHPAASIHARDTTDYMCRQIVYNESLMQVCSCSDCDLQNSE